MGNHGPRNILMVLLSRKIVVVAAALVILFYLLGTIGWIFAPYDYRAQDLTAIRQAPSFEHWFGTDLLGRDIFTRVLYAARTSTILSLAVAVVGGLPIAVAMGMIAGYYGKRVDFIIMRIGELLISVPALFLILFLRATVRERYDTFIYNLGPLGESLARQGWMDLAVIFLVTSFIYWVGPARLFRSQVLILRNSLFVKSSIVIGSSQGKIIWKHIFPHLIPLIVLSAFSMLAGVIGTEIALSFFGIGIRPPTPSFGAMISEVNIQLLSASPHLLLFPGLIAALFIYSLLFIEMNLNQVLSSIYERRK